MVPIKCFYVLLVKILHFAKRHVIFTTACLCLLSRKRCDRLKGGWAEREGSYKKGSGEIYKNRDEMGPFEMGWDHFYGGTWPLETTCKDFNLAIRGGLGWMKWLKNGTGKGFMFHAIIPALYPFWSKFYWLKCLYIQYAWISIMTNKIVIKMWRLKMVVMVVFAKTFDLCHHKFNFGNFFRCHVKL